MFANGLEMTKLHWEQCNILLKGEKRKENGSYPVQDDFRSSSTSFLFVFWVFVCLFVSPAELLDFPPEASFDEFSDFNGKSEKQVGSFC